VCSWGLRWPLRPTWKAAAWTRTRVLDSKGVYVYYMHMRVTWDLVKARINHEKHGIRFSDAEIVLWDPQGVTIEDEAAEGEQRQVTIGSDTMERILVVVYTLRDDEIRLISARKATKQERRSYEKGI